MRLPFIGSASVFILSFIKPKSQIYAFFIFQPCIKASLSHRLPAVILLPDQLRLIPQLHPAKNTHIFGRETVYPLTIKELGISFSLLKPYGKFLRVFLQAVAIPRIRLVQQPNKISVLFQCFRSLFACSWVMVLQEPWNID